MANNNIACDISWGEGPWHSQLDFSLKPLRDLTPEAASIVRRLLLQKYQIQFGITILGVTIDFGDGKIFYPRMLLDVPFPFPKDWKCAEHEIRSWFARFQKVIVKVKNTDVLHDDWTVEYGIFRQQSGTGTGSTLSAAIVEAEMSLALSEAHV